MNLTPRQRQILTMAAYLPNKVIAVRLNLSERTIKNHLNLIYSELSLQDIPMKSRRLQAVLLALDRGLINEDNIPDEGRAMWDGTRWQQASAARERGNADCYRYRVNKSKLR